MCLEKNDTLVVGMAGVLFGSRFFRRFESMPDGFAGGVFKGEECTDADMICFIDSILKYFKQYRIVRADIHSKFVPFDRYGFERYDSYSHVLDISGDEYIPPSRKIREHLRKADREESIIAIFDNPDRLDEFYELVRMTERRHGNVPRYEKSIFDKIFEIAQHDDRIMWPMVLYQGKMIASRISFVENNQIFNWQSFSDKNYTAQRPNYYLMDYIIKQAIERGIQSLNMGWSPPDAVQLINYKERWGGCKIETHGYTYYNRLGKFVYGLK